MFFKVFYFGLFALYQNIYIVSIFVYIHKVYTLFVFYIRLGYASFPFPCLFGDRGIIIIKMVHDLFENKILCKKCEKPMKRADEIRNGFIIRVMACDRCKEKILHPVDSAEYDKFVNLKNKTFKVKLRLVGNSYAVSIPKEIVSFMREQEHTFNELDNMVKLCFDQVGKLTLDFEDKLRKGIRGI